MKGYGDLIQVPKAFHYALDSHMLPGRKTLITKLISVYLCAHFIGGKSEAEREMSTGYIQLVNEIKPPKITVSV